jgi:hypothetical protein
MRKTSVLLFLLMLVQNYAFPQEFRLMNRPVGFELGIHWSEWMNPSAGVKTEDPAFNEGFIGRIMYHFRLNDSNTMRLQLGIGFSNYNMHNNVFTWSDSRAGSSSQLHLFPAGDRGTIYSRNKLSLTYLDIPLTFTVKAHSGLKFTVGFSAGILLDGHTKTKFIRDSTAGNNSIVKWKNRGPFTQFRYGPEVRLGYKYVSIYFKYDMNSSVKFYPDGFNVFSIGLMVGRY